MNKKDLEMVRNWDWSSILANYQTTTDPDFRAICAHVWAERRYLDPIDDPNRSN